MVDRESELPESFDFFEKDQKGSFNPLNKGFFQRIQMIQRIFKGFSYTSNVHKSGYLAYLIHLNCIFGYIKPFLMYKNTF